MNVWHHIALVYDSDTVHFYLDGERSTDQADHGDMVAKATDVFIGQAGTGSDHEVSKPTSRASKLCIHKAVCIYIHIYTTQSPNLLVCIQYFTGLIDEVKIYSRALGHDEVLEVFRSTVHNGTQSFHLFQSASIHAVAPFIDSQGQ